MYSEYGTLILGALGVLGLYIMTFFMYYFMRASQDRRKRDEFEREMRLKEFELEEDDRRNKSLEIYEEESVQEMHLSNQAATLYINFLKNTDRSLLIY